MNIIFAGTPEFSAVSLQSLVDAGYRVPLVITQPDRRAGRGMSVSKSEVKEMATDLGIETYQPPSLKSPEVLEKLKSVNADLMIVVAFGQIVPKSILDAFRFGCINVHASLLPRWRGAAPIQRAIMAGDTETGVCIMRMAEGLDTGPVVLERRIPIDNADTSGTLHNKLAHLGAEALIQSLTILGDENLPIAQEDVHATYAHKISTNDARIDWSANAADINRLIRAMNPVPGAYTFFGDTRIKIWETRVVNFDNQQDSPGTVIELTQEGFLVSCGSGTLKIMFIQKAGGRKGSASEYVRASNLELGYEFK
ncbi:MAG: methionyl-tRNA formyltransferase [Burkholderiales bacterium]|nr:methionyl-tRNA formyltransferase [Burkholderiales bacterium]